MRRMKTLVTAHVLEGVIENVQEAKGKEVIKDANLNFQPKEDELYTSLCPNLSVTGGECHEVNDRNGFEVFRLVSIGLDVVLGMTGLDMGGEMTNYGELRMKKSQ